LTATNSKQLGLNINSYLDKVETTATLLFADEEYYQYDATDSSLDEYTQLKIEEKIADRIVDLGLMENFADFGIVYANDHTVGWISHLTEEMFQDGGMYDTFSECITRQTTSDGWVFGLNNNTDRMYYVKRLNPNAVLITSFYNRELDSAFQYSEDLEDMTIRLVNEQGMILFSSEKSEIGNTLPTDIEERISSNNSATIMDDDYLINSNVCKNGWEVICSIPTKILFKQDISLRHYAILFAAILCAAFILIGLFIIQKITKPMDGMVSHLEVKADIDQLSGLLNKISFQNKVQQKIAYYNPDRIFVFIMMDADNFKQINDRLGHAYGDQVIVRISNTLKKHFDDYNYVGRIGGDEFAVYTEFYNTSIADIRQKILSDMDDFFSSYAKEFHKECIKCGLTISAGISITQDEKMFNFQKIYLNTDAALYVSKKSGKNKYTLYQEGMEENEDI
jgi:diguanylate cyclase (GGDEF)-like protein